MDLRGNCDAHRSSLGQNRNVKPKRAREENAGQRIRTPEMLALRRCNCNRWQKGTARWRNLRTTLAGTHCLTRRREPRYFSPGSRVRETIDLRRRFGLNQSIDAAFVGPDLLEVPGGHGLGGGNGSFVSIAPDGVNVVVFGEGLQQLRNVAGDNVYGSARADRWYRKSGRGRLR